jgi:Zn-dependent peptidase ImmA (M78 family)
MFGEMVMSQELAHKLRELLELGDRMGLPSSAWRSAGVSGELRRSAFAGRLEGWTVTIAARLARLVGFDDAVLWRDAPLPASSSRHFHGGVRLVPPHDQVLAGSAVSVAAAVMALRPAPAPTRRQRRQLPKEHVKPYQQGYRLAVALRKELGNPAQPIDSMVRLTEDRLGVPVVFAPLSEKTYGITAAGEGAVVVLIADRLRSNPAVLRRTLAHELCHALYDPLDVDGTFATSDGEESSAGEGDVASVEPVERRARAFSAELLMPQAGLESFLRGRGTSTEQEVREVTLDVSRHFGAPLEMARRHLCNRKFLDERWLEEGHQGESPRISPEPDGTLFQRVLQEATERDEISGGRARELLAMLDRRAWA